MPFAKQPSWDTGLPAPVWVLAGGTTDTLRGSSRCGARLSRSARDPEIGYTPDAQIELASVGLRHYNRVDQTSDRAGRHWCQCRLSLSPIDALSFAQPSWKINTGHEHNSLRQTVKLCSNGAESIGGIGAASGIALAETGKFSLPSQARRGRPIAARYQGGLSRRRWRNSRSVAAISPTDGN